MIIERKIASLERRAVRKAEREAAKAEAKATQEAAKAEAAEAKREREAHSRDLARLASVSAPHREQPSARLTMPQLFEVERMSAQGMLLDEIAARLAIPLDVFELCMRGSTQIRDAFIAGKNRGKDIATGTILTATQAGDVGAAKYYLDRVGGEQWKPKPAAPAVVVHTGPVWQADMDDVNRRFARQGALLDGRTIDVEADGSE